MIVSLKICLQLSRPDVTFIYVGGPNVGPSGEGEESQEGGEVLSLRPNRDLKPFFQMIDEVSEEAVEALWYFSADVRSSASEQIGKESVLDGVRKSLKRYGEANLMSIKTLVKSSNDRVTAYLAMKSMLRNAAIQMAETHYKVALLTIHNSRDKLTGLANRDHFDRELAIALQRRDRLQEVFSIVAFDIDHFKGINDTYGHAAGDAVLREIGRRLGAAVRMPDIPARTGGEEFTVILPSTPEMGALVSAWRMRGAIHSKPFMTKQGEINVTVSMGVAEHASIAIDPHGELVMEAADSSLYVVKNNGRAQIACQDKIVPIHVIEQLSKDMRDAHQRFTHPSSRPPKNEAGSQ